MSHLNKPRKIIIIDAIRAGEKPGKVYRFDYSELGVVQAGMPSAHQITTMEAVELLRQVYPALSNCEIVVIGIEPKAIELHTGLSEEVRESIAVVMRLILGEVYLQFSFWPLNRIVLVALLLVGLFGMNKSARAGNDWEYWNNYAIAGLIRDDLRFKVKTEFRYNDNAGNHYYSHYDVGLDWKIKDWFILGPYYRHVNEKKQRDWKVEYRPHLNATFRWELFGLAFSDRNRLEYRIREDRSFVRYRNKLTANLRSFTQFKIQPYVADELFYDFYADEFNKNRVYAGFDLDLIKRLKAGVYYILECRRKKGNWTKANVIGVGLKYTF